MNGLIKDWVARIQQRDRVWYMTIQRLRGKHQLVDRWISWLGRFGPLLFFLEMGGIFVILGIQERSNAVKVLYVLLVAIAAALSTKFIIDPLAARIARVRPFVKESVVPLVAKDPQDPSFPSNHAGGAFALGIFLSIAFPHLLFFSLGLAILISFSRVYIGLHYFTDVLVGGMIGTLVSLLYWKIWL
ncbi:phosphatase PAP2 family protein [Sulfoacidibacillus thermotolerans]|uniref:phosphatase PAP2 family protein n=1 Tax=Sulfoacidibacillus thermotolerans TaxID=1765684 RepID=UPI0015E806F9|nr:phosphatase PAP2 family protein [Sulfoacidibacillus thermotolerans]